MKKITTLFLLLSLGLHSLAQTTTVTIGTTTNLYDSTFVIQTGAADSFYQAIHPGAGPYMNGEIYLCANSTLTYNYSPGTSSSPTFYLEENAQLIFTQAMMSGTVYMKNGASVSGNNQMNFLYIKRVAGSTVSNFGAGSTIQDSVFSTVNYSFTGWPNNSSPCQAPTAVSQAAAARGTLILYPNPAKDRLYLSSHSDDILDVCIMTPGGQAILQRTIRSSENIPLYGLASGFYFVVVRLADGKVEYGRFIRE